MRIIEPYIEAHNEAVYRKRCDGRLHDIRESWWALIKAIKVYEPRPNVPAIFALMGWSAVFGAIAGLLIGLAR